MSDRATRAWICGLSAVALALLAVAGVVWLVQGLCESVDQAERGIVRCDHERGHTWRVVSVVLLAGAGVALLAGIRLAVAKARFWPFAAGCALATASVVAVFAIGEIRLADKPVPRLSAVRAVDRRCVAPCAGGIRVAFTVDRRARVSLALSPEANDSIEFRPYREGGYRYRSGRVARAGALPEEDVEFAAGQHVVRVGALVEVMEPRERREPLPPGLYLLQVTAYAPGAGNQQGQTSATFSSGVRLLPDRG